MARKDNKMSVVYKSNYGFEFNLEVKYCFDN